MACVTTALLIAKCSSTLGCNFNGGCAERPFKNEKITFLVISNFFEKMRFNLDYI